MYACRHACIYIACVCRVYVCMHRESACRVHTHFRCKDFETLAACAFCWVLSFLSVLILLHLLLLRILRMQGREPPCVAFPSSGRSRIHGGGGRRFVSLFASASSCYQSCRPPFTCIRPHPHCCPFCVEMLGLSWYFRRKDQASFDKFSQISVPLQIFLSLCVHSCYTRRQCSNSDRCVPE